MARRENFEDEKFEKAWEEAFEDASRQPDPRVWGNIERELAYGQMAVLRRKARFYQWTAAAAVFIAALFGINYLVSYQDSINNTIVQNQNAPLELSEDPESGSTDESVLNSGIIVKDDSESTQSISNTRANHYSKSTQSISNIGANNYSGTEEESNGSFVYYREELAYQDRDGSKYQVLTLDDQSSLQPEIHYNINAQTDRRMYNKPISGKFAQARKRKSESHDKFWAGVGMGSGSFDPNYQSGPSNLLASSLDLATAENFAMSNANSFRVANQSPAVREGMRSGTTIDLGVNFGMRISDNWIIESGVFYTQADATTQTNVVVESPNSVEPIAASSETRGVTQLNSIIGAEKFIQYNYQDVDLDNQFQFASVPLKAGFILIDSRLNIVVNAGVATNFYLGNRLVDPNSEVANVSIGPGVSSPYREISFAGLGGLQIGYSIFDQVELTVEPYMRQPITSLTKQSTSFVASPSGYGINTGIRYRFN